MTGHLPRCFPATMADVARPLVDRLGPLVPPAHAARIAAALTSVPAAPGLGVGLEVVLAPHAPACDLSLLLPVGRPPAFLTERQQPLVRFERGAVPAAATVDPRLATTWWEYDTSDADPAAGVFVRALDGDAAGTLRRCADGLTGPVADAVAALERFLTDRSRNRFALVGIFADRRPGPIAAALLPLPPTARDLAIRHTLAAADISFDPDDPYVTFALGHFDAFALGVAASADGRVAVSLEAAFAAREHALRDRRWDGALTAGSWGPAADGLHHLLAVQDAHAFDAIPPVLALSMIDHLKFGAGGRVKAYVGTTLTSALTAARTPSGRPTG